MTTASAPGASSADVSGEAPPVAACSCGPASSTARKRVRWATAGGVLSALGLCAACCLLPAILAALGAAASWVGALRAFVPYKWLFVLATATLLGYAFLSVYRPGPPACTAGTACPGRRTDRASRIWLWLGTAVALAGLAFGFLDG
jgi:hypothetical protein